MKVSVMAECVFHDVKVVWDDRTLCFSNSGYSRKYSLKTPLLHTVEMMDGQGKVFATETAGETDNDFYGQDN